MKATELRMGDWVLVDGEPMKIAETDLTYFSAWKKDGTFCGKIGYEAAEPIALTEEILEKNDWDTWPEDEDCCFATFDFNEESEIEVLVDMFAKKGEWKVAVCNREGEDVISHYLRHIKYVHELQHLLWALGIEKEVEV
jgi:hypothetical protein